jgi:hypothetical protein
MDDAGSHRCGNERPSIPSNLVRITFARYPLISVEPSVRDHLLCKRYVSDRENSITASHSIKLQLSMTIGSFGAYKPQKALPQYLITMINC